MKISLAATLCCALSACGFEGADGVTGVEANPGGGSGSGSGSGSGGQTHDADHDGVMDAADNCVNTANPEQYNEDGDSVGDACDNCPHVANPNQEDLGELNASAVADGVGDACDPNPDKGGDHLALFLGFNKASDFTGWQVAGPQDFAVSGGKLINRVKTDLALAWNGGLALKDAVLVTKVTYVSLSTTYDLRGAALMGRFGRGGAAGALGTGIGCGDLRDVDNDGGAPHRNAAAYQGPNFNNLLSTDSTLTAGTVAIYQTKLVSNAVECRSGTETWTRANNSPYGGVALSVWGAAVDFEYLVAYTR